MTWQKFQIRKTIYIFLILNFCSVLNVVFFSFFLLPGILILCAHVSEHSVYSFFIGGVSKKNNRDEIGRVFIQVKVWLKNSLSQLEGGSMGKGMSE
jgi:hypothetical protein